MITHYDLSLSIKYEPLPGGSDLDLLPDDGHSLLPSGGDGVRVLCSA